MKAQPTTTEIRHMNVADFLKLNYHTESYSMYWRWIRDEEQAKVWFEKPDAIQAAERDIAIFRARLANHEDDLTPIVGQWVRGYDGEMTRLTHNWNDGVQTGGGHGSFYLCSNGHLSYSGGLDPSIPYDLLELTNERAMSQCWIFHNNCSGAHRGVYYNYPFKVWRVKEVTDQKDIDRLPYQYRTYKKNHAKLNTY